MNHRTRSAFALAALLLAGCTSFTQTVPVGAIPDQPATDRRFQIWTKGEHYELHDVHITDDTLAGVRYWHSPGCDSCRVAIARTEVDSVRILAFDGAETAVVSIIATPFILAGILVLLLIPSGGRLWG
jgi:hypothetical protein